MGAEPESVDGRADTLGEELRRAVGRFVRAVRIDAGTPHSGRSETLALLESQGAMNIAALAHLRKVKHQTMRLIVCELEVGGLVLRTTDPDDRRSRIFSITEAGRDALGRERKLRVSKIDQLLLMHVSEEETAVLHRAIMILDRISTATGR